MPYIQNPHMPRVRMQAVRLVQQGWSKRKAARYLGVNHSSVIRWCKKAERLPSNIHTIPTIISRPHSHPNALNLDIVNRIVSIRNDRGRCAEIIHKTMLEEEYSVSLSSVKRTLDRHGLTNKRSPWKKYHPPSERPKALNTGDLVEIDTVHSFIYTSRVKFFVYTLIDVYSRWAWADVVMRINTHASIAFVRMAQRNASFQFKNMQSDHGSEFSTHFTQNVGVSHRHIHVRSPNENGHLERFNRTIQEECFSGVPRNPDAWKKVLPEYLQYYNHERMHMGIDFKRPIELTKWLQAID